MARTPQTNAGTRKAGNAARGSIHKHSVTAPNSVRSGPRKIRGIWFDPRPLSRAQKIQGMTLESLAGHLGCTKSQVFNLLVGTCPNSQLMRPLARLLGVSLEACWPETRPADIDGEDAA